MDKHIALLRGINVGGHRKIKMKSLRNLFDSLGFENVVTYIQSGNVLFDTRKMYTAARLTEQLEQQIEESFGHDVRVIITDIPEVKDILESFPFVQQDGWKSYISFLSEKPPAERTGQLESRSGKIEQFRVKNRVVYSWVDKRAKERPLFSNNFIEQQLGMYATTRNLRTVGKILELAERT